MLARAFELLAQERASPNAESATQGTFVEGLARLFAGDLSGAEEAQRELALTRLRKGTGESEAHALAAELALIRGDPAAARAILEELVERVPDRVELRYALGHALLVEQDGRAEAQLSWGRRNQRTPHPFLGFVWHRSAERVRRVAAGEVWWPGAR